MIRFQFQKNFTLSNRTILRKNLEFLLTNEGFSSGSLEIVFCSDDFLLGINQDFLNHDYYTDIITFGEVASDNTISGELYISIDRVKENSSTFNKSLKEELHRVIFHGLLHICGYGDKTAKEIKQMRKKEDYYLDLFR